MMLFSLTISLLPFVLSSASGKLPFISDICPPEGFDSIREFDPNPYFAGIWYTLKQAPNHYQTLEKFFCIAANYTIRADTKVDVYNRDRIGAVDGPLSGTNLVAFIPNPEVPSKAKVGPPFIPEELYGDYWVVAIGNYSDIVEGYESSGEHTYEWAVIVDGMPTQERNGACLPDNGEDNEGFWLLSRIAEPGKAAVDAVEQVAADLQLDTSILVAAVHSQDGKVCTYDDLN